MDIRSKTIRRRRFILLTAVILLIVGGLLYWLLSGRKQAGPKDGFLFSSDIVLSNTQFANRLTENNTLNKSFYFFTGSNIATTKLSDFSEGITTQSLQEETAYLDVQKVNYNAKANTALIKVSYSGDEPFLKLRDASGSAVSSGTHWVLQAGKNNPTVISFSRENPIIDAQLVEKTIIAVLYGENGNQIITYDIATNERKTLLSNTSANKIIGASKNTLALRDPKGKVLLLNTQNLKVETFNEEGMASYDDRTESVVIENNLNKTKGFSAKILKSGNAKEIKLAYKYVYVSGGYIINTDNDTNPGAVNTLEINTDSQKEYEVARENTRLQDSLTAVTVIQKDPLLLAAISSTNKTFLIGRLSTVIRSVPTFKYPVFNSYSAGGYGFNYTLGTNTSTIVTNDTNNITKTLESFKLVCGCDINQVNKVWSVGEPDGEGPVQDQVYNQTGGE